MNDFGRIGFVVGIPTFVTWVVATGIAILSDQAERPLYPRWSGYLSLGMGFIQLSAAVLIFFKSGPMAWNGVLPWYLPFTDFFAWFAIITALTIKATNKTGYEAAADAEIVPHATSLRANMFRFRFWVLTGGEAC